MLASTIFTIAAAVGAMAAPAATEADAGLTCYGGSPHVTYTTLARDVAGFCENVHSNIPNGADYGNLSGGVSFEIHYGGPKCGANSGKITKEKCEGLFNPLVKSCGDVRGTTHGGKVTKGCYTMTAVVH